MVGRTQGGGGILTGGTTILYPFKLADVVRSLIYHWHVISTVQGLCCACYTACSLGSGLPLLKGA